MEVKTTMRYQFILIKIPIINNNNRKYEVLARMWRNWNPRALLAEK